MKGRLPSSQLLIVLLTLIIALALTFGFLPTAYGEEKEEELPEVLRNYLEERKESITGIRILGGPQAVSPETEEAIASLIETEEYVEVGTQEELFQALQEEKPLIKFTNNIDVNKADLEVNYPTTLNLNHHTLSLQEIDMVISGNKVTVKGGVINSLEEEEIFLRGSHIQFLNLELKTHLVDKEAEGLAIRDSKFHHPYKETYEFVSDITIENCDFKDGLEWLQFHHDDATIQNSRFGSHVIINIYGDINLKNVEFRGYTDFSVLEVINGAEPVLKGATAKGEHVDFRVEEDSTLQIEEDILVEEELSLLGKGLLSGKGTFTGKGKVCFSQHAQPNELTVRGPTFDVKVNICHGVTTLEKAVLEQDLTVENNGKLILVEEIDNREGTTLWLDNQAEIDIHEEAVLTRDIREYVITEISSREEEVILTTDFREFTGWHFGDPHFLPDAWTVDKWIQLEEDIDYGTIEIEIEGEHYYAQAEDHDFERGVYLSQMIEPDPLPLQDQSGRGELEIILRPAELTPMEGGLFGGHHLRIEVRAFNAAGDYQILLGEDNKVIDIE